MINQTELINTIILDFKDLKVEHKALKLELSILTTAITVLTKHVETLTSKVESMSTYLNLLDEREREDRQNIDKLMAYASKGNTFYRGVMWVISGAIGGGFIAYILDHLGKK
jgi:hypothetical protein